MFVPPDKSDPAVQASDDPAPHIQPPASTELVPAAQAGSRAENAQHAHHVLDALCPDGEYQSPAAQAVPLLHSAVVCPTHTSLVFLRN